MIAYQTRTIFFFKGKNHSTPEERLWLRNFPTNQEYKQNSQAAVTQFMQPLMPEESKLGFMTT